MVVWLPEPFSRLRFFKVEDVQVPEVRHSPSRWRKPNAIYFGCRGRSAGVPPARIAETSGRDAGARRPGGPTYRMMYRPFRPSDVCTVRDRRFTPPARAVPAFQA